MYPTISHLIEDLIGIHIPLPIATFGFFLILAIYTAGQVLRSEIIRKKAQGLFVAFEETFIEGKPPSLIEIGIASLWSFVVGFKLVEAVFHYSDLVSNPQAFILSSRGHFGGGLIFAIFTAFTRFVQGQREALDTPKNIKKMIEPEDRVGTIMVMSGVAGILGSKLAHNLEHIDLLMKDPIGQLLSFTGLSFYGGLIVATTSVLLYARQKNISSLHLLDAGCPALILAYGVGRIGCQLSGDGDWGIQNTAPKPAWLDSLPDWVWSFTYPHNVLSSGIPIEGCSGKYCMELAVPVYPTPLYEVAMSFAIFGLLWAVRKRIKIPGVLFSLYLMFNGLERFLIEQIRVNPPYKFLGIEATQAELIAFSLFMGGIISIFVFKSRAQTEHPA